jgi:hypothetical protein
MLSCAVKRPITVWHSANTAFLGKINGDRANTKDKLVYATFSVTYSVNLKQTILEKWQKKKKPMQQNCI